MIDMHFGTWLVSFHYGEEKPLRIYDRLTHKEYSYSTTKDCAEEILKYLEAFQGHEKSRKLQDALFLVCDVLGASLEEGPSNRSLMKDLMRNLLLPQDVFEKEYIFEKVLPQLMRLRYGAPLAVLFEFMSEFLSSDSQQMVCRNHPDLLLNIISYSNEDRLRGVHGGLKELRGLITMMQKWETKACVKLFGHCTKNILAWPEPVPIDALTRAVLFSTSSLPMLIQFIQSLPHKDQLSIYSNLSSKNPLSRIRRPRHFMQKMDKNCYSGKPVFLQSFYEAEMAWLLNELQANVDALPADVKLSHNQGTRDKLNNTLQILQSSFRDYQESAKENKDVIELKSTWCEAIGDARKSVSADFPSIWVILAKALLAVTILGGVYLGYKAVKNYKQNRSLFFPSPVEQKLNELEDEVGNIKDLSDSERRGLSWDALLVRTP